jgi:metal-sulfur cluster biosynthetic enzyme
MTASDVREALRTVIDPEIGVNVVDLGLVYGVAVEDDQVRVTMTMTSPACPLAEYLKVDVERAVRSRVAGAQTVQIALVWDPPWTPELMSDEARRLLQ